MFLNVKKMLILFIKYLFILIKLQILHSKLKNPFNFNLIHLIFQTQSILFKQKIKINRMYLNFKFLLLHLNFIFNIVKSFFKIFL